MSAFTDLASLLGGNSEGWKFVEGKVLGLSPLQVKAFDIAFSPPMLRCNAQLLGGVAQGVSVAISQASWTMSLPGSCGGIETTTSGILAVGDTVLCLTNAEKFYVLMKVV